MEKPIVIGLDIGTKRTGVAVSDENRSIAFPLKQFEAKTARKWLGKLEQIIAQYPVEAFVVGVPYDPLGEEGHTAKKLRPFVAALQERFKMPVIKWDERFTTAQAEESLISADVSRKKRRKVLDKIAATILLQHYLDHSKPEP